MKQCIAKCIAEKIDMDCLKDFEWLEPEKAEIFNEGIALALKDQRYIIVFEFGCVVYWDCDQNLQTDVENFLKRHSPSFHNKYPVLEQVNYRSHEQNFINELNDHVLVKDTSINEVLSFSYPLAQSVKLEYFENAVDETINQSRKFPEELARKGKISLSREKLAQYTGWLFMQRHSINLDTYLLDLPEFFWRRPSLELTYAMVRDYLDLPLRLKILNGKLAVLYELYEILSNELKHGHSSFLEWIIIVLISLEIILSLLAIFYGSYFH